MLKFEKSDDKFESYLYRLSNLGLKGASNSGAFLGVSEINPEGFYLSIMPTIFSDLGARNFEVESVEEAEYIVSEFVISFNDEYKAAIWRAGRLASGEIWRAVK